VNDLFAAALLKRFDFNFAYDEVMRQIFDATNAGKTPARIRFSYFDHMELRRCAEYLTHRASALPGERREETFCGLPVVMDPDYAGPIAVECRGEGPAPR
jgi:hypothetical protein